MIDSDTEEGFLAIGCMFLVVTAFIVFISWLIQAGGLNFVFR